MGYLGAYIQYTLLSYRCLDVLLFLNYLRINKPVKSYGLPAELTVPYCAIDV
jgi:hypothetical protein